MNYIHVSLIMMVIFYFMWLKQGFSDSTFLAFSGVLNLIRAEDNLHRKVDLEGQSWEPLDKKNNKKKKK